MQEREYEDKLTVIKSEAALREENYKQVIDKIKFDLSVAFDRDETNQVLIKTLQSKIDDRTSFIDHLEKKINHIQTQMHAVQDELEKYYAVGCSQSSLLDSSLEVQNKTIALLLRSLHLGQSL